MTKAKEEDTAYFVHSTSKKKITNYYQNNKGRMRYKKYCVLRTKYKYKNIGCGIIGSGAIESAHRTVMQKRMKQSGQRWSIDGAKNTCTAYEVRVCFV